MGRHLDSTDAKIRRLGMIIGECVALKTDLNDDNKYVKQFTLTFCSLSCKILHTNTQQYLANIHSHDEFFWQAVNAAAGLLSMFSSQFNNLQVYAYFE